MIRLIALLLFTLPVHAGVILKETLDTNINTSKRWVYEDGIIEVFLTAKETESCMGRRYLYVIATGSHKIEGCWEEIESLVHIKYDNGHKFVIKADKFVERKVSDRPIIKVKE